MNVKALIKPVAVLAAVFVLLLALSAGLAPTAAENAAAEQARLFDTLLPGGAPFTEEAYNGEDTAIAAVHRGSTGYIVETVTAGYAGDNLPYWYNCLLPIIVAVPNHFPYVLSHLRNHVWQGKKQRCR